MQEFRSNFFWFQPASSSSVYYNFFIIWYSMVWHGMMFLSVSTLKKVLNNMLKLVQFYVLCFCHKFQRQITFC